MKTTVRLSVEHIGKFTVIKAGDRSIPVKIVTVGGGMCVLMVLDSAMPLRSMKMRYDEAQEIDIYDTAEEAENWVKNWEESHGEVEHTDSG
jgi:hypothetical protein